MARRVEISFENPSNITDMECCLYNLPNYNHIFNIDFAIIYKIATNNQRKKLDKLNNDRTLEVVINIDVDDLRGKRDKEF